MDRAESEGENFHGGWVSIGTSKSERSLISFAPRVKLLKHHEKARQTMTEIELKALDRSFMRPTLATETI